MSSVDADTLKDMGSLLRGLDASDMNDMPASSLDDPDVMSTMSNLDFAPSQARTLLSKVNKQGIGPWKDEPLLSQPAFLLITRILAVILHI